MPEQQFKRQSNTKKKNIREFVVFSVLSLSLFLAISLVHIFLIISMNTCAYVYPVDFFSSFILIPHLRRTKPFFASGFNYDKYDKRYFIRPISSFVHALSRMHSCSLYLPSVYTLHTPSQYTRMRKIQCRSGKCID